MYVNRSGTDFPPTHSYPFGLAGNSDRKAEGKEIVMLILVAMIPVLLALSSSGMLVESQTADDLSRMGVAVRS